MHSMPSFSLNDSFVEIQLPFIAKINILSNSTGGPDVMYRIFVRLCCWRLRYDLYESASKIALKATCRN